MIVVIFPVRIELVLPKYKTVTNTQEQRNK